MNILLIGSGAREHSLAIALKKSAACKDLFCFGSSNNPGITALCKNSTVGKLNDTTAMARYAQENAVDFAVVGPELPLSVGVVDALATIGIPCIGPTQQHAQIEASKGFTRDLFRDYNIPGLAKYKRFTSLNGVEAYTSELGDYVVKADGLMGGKGVKVYGEHLHTYEDTKKYCEELINAGATFLIEEKFIGQEFSLMSFSDGEHLAHMPAVQDHKRADVGDTGPNTGGMGSYSDANHSLPFLNDSDIAAARHINECTIKALREKFGNGYKGILYGGFMATKEGVKIIEYNARLGDPESMNVLTILTSDFVELCQAILQGTLTADRARFEPLATVCKYAVPEGYPDNPVKNERIDVSAVTDVSQLRYASVDQTSQGLIETGSRALAVIATAPTIEEAEKKVEIEINKIKGPLFHRADIGTPELIQKRIAHMRAFRPEQ